MRKTSLLKPASSRRSGVAGAANMTCPTGRPYKTRSPPTPRGAGECQGGSEARQSPYDPELQSAVITTGCAGSRGHHMANEKPLVVHIDDPSDVARWCKRAVDIPRGRRSEQNCRRPAPRRTARIAMSAPGPKVMCGPLRRMSDGGGKPDATRGCGSRRSLSHSKLASDLYFARRYTITLLPSRATSVVASVNSSPAKLIALFASVPSLFGVIDPSMC